jgi:hypothetical protein
VVTRRARCRARRCLGLLVPACARLQARDVPPAVDHRAQAEVVARWGRPERVIAGTEGQTLLIETVYTPCRRRVLSSIGLQIRPVLEGRETVASPTRIAISNAHEGDPSGHA